MFTGIIQSTGTIKGVHGNGDSCTIYITPNHDFNMNDIAIGDSIAVDGTCLTVIEKERNSFGAYVLEETIRLTTLGDAKTGAAVNLEKALKVSDRLGGHIITGHIDATGAIIEKRFIDKSAVIKFSIPQGLSRQVVQKGGVAVDGISLTVAEKTDTDFTVYIIPHTLNATTLGIKTRGARVNIETDIIGKYVERFLLPYTEDAKTISSRHETGSVNTEFLIRHGFIGKE